MGKQSMKLDQVTIPADILRRAIACLALAENKGTFKVCAAPNTGVSTLAALEHYLKGVKA